MVVTWDSSMILRESSTGELETLTGPVLIDEPCAYKGYDWISTCHHWLKSAWILLSIMPEHVSLPTLSQVKKFLLSKLNREHKLFSSLMDQAFFVSRILIKMLPSSRSFGLCLLNTWFLSRWCYNHQHKRVISGRRHIQTESPCGRLAEWE